MRRLLPLLGLLVLLAGCGGGTQTADQKARKEFLFKYPNLNDPQLSRLCPGLYPRDYRNPKRASHYHYEKKDLTKAFPKDYVARGLQADAAKVPGCKGPGTPPKD
jgi:hypothetical protein